MKRLGYRINNILLVKKTCYMRATGFTFLAYTDLFLKKINSSEVFLNIKITLKFVFSF